MNLAYLAKKLLEKREWQASPGDGVRNRGEDPIQLPKRRLAIVGLPRHFIDKLRVDIQVVAHDKPMESRTDGGG